MSYKNYSNQKIDKNFDLLINSLNKHKVPYWVCHGSLLGLIRDQNLISWDDDIDIGVFKSEVQKEKIKQILVSSGFIDRGGDHGDSLHLKKEGGKNVDINFYDFIDKYKKEECGVFWKISKPFILFKLLNIVCDTERYNGRYYLIVNFLKKINFIFKPIKDFLDIWRLTYDIKGYKTPYRYLKNFKFLSIGDLDCRIPVDSEKICAFIYGVDWLKPVKNYDWTKDSKATVKIKE